MSNNAETPTLPKKRGRKPKQVIVAQNVLNTPTDENKINGEIINYSLEYNFNKIDKLFIKPNNYEELIPETENKNIIDWGHHIIRYAVFRYNIMANICNNEKLINDDNDYIDQFITILKKISELQIKILLYNDSTHSLSF